MIITLEREGTTLTIDVKDYNQIAAEMVIAAIKAFRNESSSN